MFRKPVYIEAYNHSTITDVTVNISRNEQNDSWDIQVKTYLSSSDIILLKGRLTLELFTDITVVNNFYEMNITKNSDGEFVMVANFSIPIVSFVR